MVGGSKIRIITTGGTIDKIYFDRKSEYQIGEPQIGEVLREANVTVDFEVLPLMRKDSLDLTTDDRQKIRVTIDGESGRLFVVTHGTDTMAETGRALMGLRDKVVVLTGALQPARFRLTDAVFNIGRSTLVAEALRSGDEKLLVESMQDRLHHPYRLPLIPGSERAIQAAREQGAPAALSGAGPSVIAFIRSRKAAANVEQAMKKAFQAEGIHSRSFLLSPVSGGAEVVTL